MKEILLSICAAAVMTAIFKAIAPMEKFGTQIKLLISCFFAVTVLNAFDAASAAWDLSDIIVSEGAYNDYSLQVTESVKAETAGVLHSEISAKLAAENIYPEKIYIDIHIEDNDRISINEIRLVFAAGKYDMYAERAVAVVRSLTGTSVKVTAEQGGSQ